MINRRVSTGVTLIEMLIGLIIVLIGMTVAVPSFQGMVARNNVAAEVNEMLLAINWHAVRRGVRAQASAFRLRPLSRVTSLAPVTAWYRAQGN